MPNPRARSEVMSRREATNIKTMGQGSIPRGGTGGSPPPPVATMSARTMGQGGQPRPGGSGGVANGGPPPLAPPNSPTGD